MLWRRSLKKSHTTNTLYFYFHKHKKAERRGDITERTEKARWKKTKKSIQKSWQKSIFASFVHGLVVWWEFDFGSEKIGMTAECRPALQNYRALN